MLFEMSIKKLFAADLELASFDRPRLIATKATGCRTNHFVDNHFALTSSSDGVVVSYFTIAVIAKMAAAVDSGSR